MELGNLVFGNSRGKYAVPRTKRYEAPIQLLISVLPTDKYGNPVLEFRNDVFAYRHYYYGDCTCGFAEKESAWNREHTHTIDCDISKAALELGEYCLMILPSKTVTAQLAQTIVVSMQKYRQQMKSRLKTLSNGEVDCTCGHKEELAKFYHNNDHASDCKLVLPNFEHYASGYKLKWYKYPLRDSYANKDLGDREFGEIVLECVNSLVG